jgi:hypothetical protein
VAGHSECELATRLDALTAQGRDLAHVMYGSRSLALAVPEQQPGSGTEAVEVEVFAPELARIKQLVAYVSAASDALVETVVRLATLEVGGDGMPAPVGLQVAALRTLDAVFVLDCMKDVRTNLKADFNCFKQAFVRAGLGPTELAEVQAFLSNQDPKKAYNYALMSLRETLGRIKGSDRVLCGFLNLVLDQLDGRMFVAPEERFGLMRLVPHLMVLVDGDTNDPKSYNVFQGLGFSERFESSAMGMKKGPAPPSVSAGALQKVVRRFPVVPVFHDVTLVLVSVLERAPHFNRAAMGDAWGAGAFAKAQPEPEYDVSEHWGAIRTDFSAYMALLAAVATHDDTHKDDAAAAAAAARSPSARPGAVFSEGLPARDIQRLTSTSVPGAALVERARATVELALKGVALLSQWSFLLQLALAWMYTHPSGGPLPVYDGPKKPRRNSKSNSGGDYDRVVRNNLRPHDLCALGDIVSMVKRLAAALQRAEARWAPLVRVHMHHRIQQLARGYLLPLLHRVDNRKKAALAPLLTLRAMVADPKVPAQALFRPRLVSLSNLPIYFSSSLRDGRRPQALARLRRRQRLQGVQPQARRGDGRPPTAGRGRRHRPAPPAAGTNPRLVRRKIAVPAKARPALQTGRGEGGRGVFRVVLRRVVLLPRVAGLARHGASVRRHVVLVVPRVPLGIDALRASAGRKQLAMDPRGELRRHASARASPGYPRRRRRDRCGRGRGRGHGDGRRAARGGKHLLPPGRVQRRRRRRVASVPAAVPVRGDRGGGRPGRRAPRGVPHRRILRVLQEPRRVAPARPCFCQALGPVALRRGRAGVQRGAPPAPSGSRRPPRERERGRRAPFPREFVPRHRRSDPAFRGGRRVRRGTHAFPLATHTHTQLPPPTLAHRTPRCWCRVLPTVEVPLRNVLDVLRATHRLIVRDTDLHLDAFDAIFHEVDESLHMLTAIPRTPNPPAAPATPPTHDDDHDDDDDGEADVDPVFRGRVGMHLLHAVTQDLPARFAYNLDTGRFVRTESSVAAADDDADGLGLGPGLTGAGGRFRGAMAAAYGPLCCRAFEAQVRPPTRRDVAADTHVSSPRPSSLSLSRDRRH